MTLDEIRRQILKSTNETTRLVRDVEKVELDSGDPQAMYELGCRYHIGDNVEQNYEEAAKWYRAAAEQGSADGQNGIGNLYLTGEGVEQNYEEAARWCRASAEQGASNGQDSLGDCYRQWEGAGQNLEEAAKWYRASAEQGNDCGQKNLGDCYRDGLGVEQNYEEAAKWYRAAAEQGNVEATSKLQALEQDATSSTPVQPPPLPEQDHEVANAGLRTVKHSTPISSPVEPPPVPVKAMGQRIPTTISTQPTSLGVVMHLLGFTGLFFPLGNILAPLILWLVKRGDSSYLDSVGKETINFQISYTIYLTVSLILCKVWIGLIMFPVIGLMWIIFMIVAAVKAGKGMEYLYPLVIRMKSSKSKLSIPPPLHRPQNKGSLSSFSTTRVSSLIATIVAVFISAVFTAGFLFGVFVLYHYFGVDIALKNDPIAGLVGKYAGLAFIFAGLISWIIFFYRFALLQKEKAGQDVIFSINKASYPMGFSWMYGHVWSLYCLRNSGQCFMSFILLSISTLWAWSSVNSVMRVILLAITFGFPFIPFARRAFGGISCGIIVGTIYSFASFILGGAISKVTSWILS